MFGNDTEFKESAPNREKSKTWPYKHICVQKSKFSLWIE